MDERTMLQTGSSSRDDFKQRHKRLDKTLYACDLDFVLIAKTPVPDIVAAIDYKQHGDGISFSEVIAYNSLIRRGIPVFIVSGEAASGAFIIHEYLGGHHGKPTSRLSEICRTSGWSEFEEWELTLRRNYIKRFQA